jgi:hypothetical protein
LDAERERIKLEGVLQEREEDYARTQEQLEDFKRFVKEGGGGGGGGDGMLDEGEDMFDHGNGHGNHVSRDVARRLLTLSEELKVSRFCFFGPIYRPID